MKTNCSLKSVENLKNVSVENISVAIACSESYVRLVAKLHGVNADSSNEFSGKKISEFIISAYQYLPLWVVKISDGRIKRSRLRLKHFRALCLYLVEESNFLMALTDEERVRCREEISTILSNVDDYLRAEKLMEPGYFCNPESYIEKIMTKMQKTGYIHKVEEVFRIMIALFRITPKLMNDKMSQLMDILLLGNINDWQEEELRVQLMKLLDHYITKNRDAVDSMADFESRCDQDLLATITRALAMQLYLYEPATDDIDYALNRSMLYRYASHTKIAGNSIDSLLDKAYGCIIGSIDSTTRLEYTWEQIQNIGMLVSMLINTKTERKIVETIEYTAEASVLSCTSGTVAISENNGKDKAKKTFGAGMVSWHGLKINLLSEPSVKVNFTTNDVAKLQRWWVDVDNMLTQSNAKTPKTNKRRAYPDENVDIVIDGIEDIERGVFRCHIKSDKLEGCGTIAVHEIVNYKVRPETMMDISHLAFNNPQTGRPSLYEATVLTDNGTTMTFTMKKRLNDYIFNLDDICFGYETKCVITSLNVPGNICIGVSKDGIPVMLPYEDSILVGDYYDVKVTQVKGNKQGVQLVCERIGISETEVTQDKAFIQLMQEYGIEDESPVDTIENPQTKQMAKSYVQELVKLLDRESLLQKEVHRRYNYLYVAKLLSHIIKDDNHEAYYQNRLKLQRLLYDFSKNSRIDRTVLQQLETMDASVKVHYPILRVKIKELHILECLDNSEANGKLFAELQTETNNEVKRLTNLVLAYNHLAGFGLQEQRDSIIAQINELLDVRIELPDSQYFGEENDQTEFKSSVIYVANSEGKYISDIEGQTNVILKEICAFLNTKGGTLYIGVNDLGYAQGLDTDLQWFDQHKFWHVTNIDDYRQYVVNMLCRKWPNLKDMFEVTFPTIKGRSVVKITVPPCKTPVNLDGVYYSRVGSECRRITAEGLEGFLERRPMQYEQYVSKLKDA